MARKPKAIPAKAAEAWSRGDEPAAERLSGLKRRQLYTRLGSSGRAAAPPASPPPPVAPAPAPTAQALVKLPRRPAVAAPSPPVQPAAPEPPPSSPEPTAAEIDALDTREEALAVLRLLKARMASADDVRFGALAEKLLSAINRIEQIDARRPKPPAPDAVNEAIRGRMSTCVDRLLRHTRERTSRFERERAELHAWAGQELAPRVAEELRRRLDVLLGGRLA